MEIDETKHILALPDEILDKILLYGTYEEVSHFREVCKRFDLAGQRLLNQGFHRVEKYHNQCLRKVKEQLPRRESERRKHHLSPHCEILTAVETRLSLLGMTFMKYVELQLCCFFPGKVLDEIFKILRLVAAVSIPPRPHEVLQELRDISSMAMEHFDEKIAPSFRFRGAPVPKVTVTSYGSLGGPPSYGSLSAKNDERSTGVYSMHTAKIHSLLKLQNQRYLEFKRENNELRQRIAESRREMHELNQEILDRDEIIAEQNSRITEQDGKIAELNGKFVKYDETIGEVLNSLLTFREDKQLMLYARHFSNEKRKRRAIKYGTKAPVNGKRKRQDTQHTLNNKKPCVSAESAQKSAAT